MTKRYAICVAALFLLVATLAPGRVSVQGSPATREPAHPQARQQTAGAAADLEQNAGVPEMERYILNAFETLTRSMDRCQSIADPKSSTPPVIYIPADFAVPAALDSVTSGCHAQIARLPQVIHKLGEIDVKALDPHALLYLPHPYIVPGGMFNEMYGWDSYFIIRGLLESNRLEMARGMVQNFFFEISHYGGFLNANRGYMLTRSQPPFLTSMILAVYDAEKKEGRDDRKWLEEAYPFAVKDHELWVHPPHDAGPTGLARYFDFGQGPVAEENPAYYHHAAGYFILHPGEAGGVLAVTGPGQHLVNPIGSRFLLKLCQETASSDCELLEEAGLTADFYKGDRSVRESGFDITFRFGPYAAGTHHYAAVCLNSLLYKVETDLERISVTLGKSAEAGQWRRLAEARRTAINKYLWSSRKGEFFDYDFTRSQQSTYEYSTTFYPLWVGLASREQAGAVERNLSSFEKRGGLMTSLKESGGQWDAPYGWAPLQLIAAEGLRRYGFAEDANRLSAKFVTTVLLNFRRDGTIREKYNVMNRSSETHVQAGYIQNVVGFGWTNGVCLVMLHSIPEPLVERIPLQN